jgi:hypothetical protein
MTPKEKAEELLNNFYQATDGHWNQVPVSKQCALIAVDETLRALHFNVWTNVEEIKYWKEVKQHIEQL